ncbi:MarR family transcriptional regulator [Pseudonocardiaceae bacterium YIM PH 21723]|nr:MarR family transcriptional regulator [Pseudonocardiaceae bacterium YIM PH 21723]
MTDGDAIKLDQMVCFALYAASRAVTQAYRPVLDALGLTYPQYLVLVVLWEREPISVKELGAALHLDSGTLSPLLKRLESAGLITRSRQAHDERSVHIALTEQGHAMRERAVDVPCRIAEVTGLDMTTATALRDQLISLADTVSGTLPKEKS